MVSDARLSVHSRPNGVGESPPDRAIGTGTQYIVDRPCETSFLDMREQAPSFAQLTKPDARRGLEERGYS